jgi:excisionase family DNA binding protein
MAQDRMEATGDGQKPVHSTSYTAPNIESTLNRAQATLNKVRVVHGANEQYFDNLNGKTVGSVRKSLREVFNIPGDADALISGQEVGDDFILEGGMNLEFVKEAGVKGSTALGLNLLTIAEVAQILKVSPQHVRNLIRRGELASLQIGSLKRIDFKELCKFGLADKSAQTIKKKPKQNLTFRISEETFFSLREIAEERQQKVSELVREVVSDYVRMATA